MEEKYPEQCVVDTNVLVYATVEAAPLCEEARIWMATLQWQNVELCVTPQICREYLVVLTGDPVFDRDFTPTEALDVLAQVRQSLRLLIPSEEVLGELFRLVRRYEVAGKTHSRCQHRRCDEYERDLTSSDLQPGRLRLV